MSSPSNNLARNNDDQIDPPDSLWASLINACVRQDFNDLVKCWCYLMLYILGNRDVGRLPGLHPPPVVHIPSMDRHEDEENNLVTILFDLPGVRREDVLVELQGEELTISGRKRKPEGLDQAGYVFQGRHGFGKFSRTVKVTAGMSSLSNVETSMENGVLAIVFPRSIY